MKKNIAIVAGGYSSERQVSLWTAENIIEALDKDLYNPYLILIDKNRWYLKSAHKEYDVNKNNFSISLSESVLNFDYAFIAIHGTPAEDGLLQGYFDIIGMKYSSSGVLASSLSFNKFAFNNFIRSFNIVNIAKSVLIIENAAYDVEEIIKTIGLPCFVKPNQQGSSFGISKVNTKDELEPAIRKAFEQDNAVIIEEFIEGTEVTNGVMKTNGSIKSLDITEIVSKNELFDFQAKYDPDYSDEITPARISDEHTNKIKRISEDIFKISGFEGIVRIDYIIRNNDIYMLEANTIPGMTSNSLIPKQLAAENKTLKDTLTLLIEK